MKTDRPTTDRKRDTDSQVATECHLRNLNERKRKKRETRKKIGSAKQKSSNHRDREFLLFRDFKNVNFVGGNSSEKLDQFFRQIYFLIADILSLIKTLSTKLVTLKQVWMLSFYIEISKHNTFKMF